MWIQITECDLCHKKLKQDSEELYWHTKMHEFDRANISQFTDAELESIKKNL